MFFYYVLIFLIISMHNTVHNVVNINNRIITTLNYSQYRVKTTIVNGEIASKGEIPYLVSLKATQTKLPNTDVNGRTLYIWDSLCGGTIIFPKKVITAAHCFELENFFLARHTSALRVVAGSLQTQVIHSGNTETTANAQWRGVKGLRIHENFIFPLNDIALVTVDVPFQFNDDVSSIPYVRTVVDYPEVCRAAGYGDLSEADNQQIRAPALMVAVIKTMPRWRCSGIWGMDMSSYVCTDSVRSDVALGDSGGPLACTGTLDPNETPGKDILLGIVSGKNFDRTTLFTRVSEYKDWIEDSPTFVPTKFGSLCCSKTGKYGYSLPTKFGSLCCAKVRTEEDGILKTCEKERVIMTLKYAAQRMKTVIVHGKPAAHGSVPYIVSIKEPTRKGLFSSTYENLCGGTIINTRKVLTAAHCFEFNYFKYAKNPSSLRVVAGDLRNAIDDSKMEAQSQWRKISAVILHPYFNFPLDDMAVIFVKPQWYFSEYVSSIKMARIPMDYSDSCYAAGYGRIGHGKNDPRSPVLLVAKIDVLSRNKCSQAWEIIMDEFICSNAVTADVAIGDSGGPLTSNGTPELPGEELLVGVTSGKNYDKTTLYTRVTAYSDWIDEVTYNKGRNLKNLTFFIFLFLCALDI